MKRQENEFLKAFSYWPTPNKRTGGNIYDVRSYRVKPGSMYDWGNYWAKGINCRKNVRADIPYGGFFSQLVSFLNIKFKNVFSLLNYVFILSFSGTY